MNRCLLFGEDFSSVLFHSFKFPLTDINKIAWHANQKLFNRLSDVVESKSMNDSTAIYVFLCDSFYVIFRCMKSIEKK